MVGHPMVAPHHRETGVAHHQTSWIHLHQWQGWKVLHSHLVELQQPSNMSLMQFWNVEMLKRKMLAFLQASDRFQVQTHVWKQTGATKRPQMSAFCLLQGASLQGNFESATESHHLQLEQLSGA